MAAAAAAAAAAEVVQVARTSSHDFFGCAGERKKNGGVEAPRVFEWNYSFSVLIEIFDIGFLDVSVPKDSETATPRAPRPAFL